ncbi:E3 ubiquitin-protein ligase HECTD3-like isoform X2 [Strigops habroptila]|uniref:E3 ubiquitin-protein ligase HECTD3-like isoform X2 n=1 Tax=Strigops habroptila TaxID=2489341 RepID=UPI0011CFE52D|nr:E3 ubiquitin-protein ligase HECTD3-like isoform X2 [Strigops habroptila]
MRAGGETPHQVLGRLRFLLQCSECFRRARALPAALCYVPREVQYKICKDTAAAAAAAAAAARSLLSVWDSPGPARGGKRAARATIEVRKGGCLRATGEEYCNGAGLWVKLSKEQLEECTGSHDQAEGWVLAQRFGEGGDRLVPVDSVEKIQWQNQTFGNDYKPAVSWEQVVDLTYCMRLGEKPRLVEQDEAAVQKFRFVPPGWSYEHDMELVRFLYDHNEKEMQRGDCMMEHISNIEVSSQVGDCGAASLTDNQTYSFWESNGPAGQHWVRLSMKKGSVIKRLWLVLDVNGNSYVPKRVAVYGGPPNRLQHLRTVLINEFVQILDSVLHYLIPLSEDSIGTFNALMGMKPFLLLSKQSAALIAHCLQSSESTPPNILPKLRINRQLAREHRTNPALDPSYRNTVFTQLYEGLRSSKHNQPLDYRWPANYSQWWECDFITEGIIDNGGGFRDTLSDVSEELCPSSGNVPVPLPFFVRTSNQGNSSSDTRDMYIPNPSCKDFPKYEWIGQLIGAALRSKEFLILALPALVWKQLAGEEVIWSKDFAAVDAELVKLLEMMEGMDREAFEFMFGKELTYTVVRSDQHVVELIPNGSNTVVRYEDRKEFIRLVQKARLEESKEQIAAMRAGLLRVVPQPVLDLLTWQLMEKKVCGDPEITVSELRRFITFEDFAPNDTCIQNFWEALKNFTSEDLSRFLKFVSGRSRLPVHITVYPERASLNAVDLMPQASTCSCTFFLPKYSSAKACEEMLRYAVYNCVSIDTDRNSWDE